jgi:hypothetical protein
MNTQILLDLRESISKEPGLISGQYWSKGLVCALGSLSSLELRIGDSMMVSPQSLGFAKFLSEKYPEAIFRDIICDIADMNDEFEGTPQERKAYMLKWIETELAQLAEPIKVEEVVTV